MQPALGVLLFAEYPTAQLVDLARLSEDLGFQYFWYTDIRFSRECYVGLTAVAAATNKLLMGPGVSDPYSRHPSATASAIASFDEFSNGRALLGLGTGGHGFRELGLEKKLPVAALRETVEMVRALLQGEEVTKTGKVISLDGGRLAFKPPRVDIPIYFATHGAQITRLAGQIADGALIANTLLPKAFDFYLRQLDEGMAKASRAPGSIDIGLRVEAAIADDDEAAFDVMRQRAAARVYGQYPHWEYLEELGLKLPQEFVELAKTKERGGAKKAAQHLPAEIVESMVLAGNPERVAAQLARALNPRVTQLTIRPHPVPGQDVSSVLRAFAEQVVPRALELRKTQAPA